MPFDSATTTHLDHPPIHSNPCKGWEAPPDHHNPELSLVKATLYLLGRIEAMLQN